MTRRWIMLTVVVGVAAFVTVQLWPQRPVWTATLPAAIGQPLAFTADGRELLAVSGAVAAIPYVPGLPPTVYRFNRVDGRPTAAQTVFAPLDPGSTPYVAMSPDGRRLVSAHRGSPRHERTTLHDLTTGTALALPDGIRFTAETFLPDGRWLWTYRQGPNNVENGVEVRDARDGQPVMLIEQPGLNTDLMCCFAPDSTTFAVMRHGRRPPIHTVELWDVPSGRLRRQFPLPAGIAWHSLDDWKDGRLHLTALGNSGRRCVSFDPEAAEGGAGRDEPLRIGDRAAVVRDLWSGPGWLAQVNPPGPAWFRAIDRWLFRKTGVTWAMSGDIELQLTFYDEGRPRSRQPPALPHPLLVSQDGRRIACAVGHRLELWDASPEPRWPWALLATAGATLPMLLLGRRGAKR